MFEPKTFTECIGVNLFILEAEQVLDSSLPMVRSNAYLLTNHNCLTRFSVLRSHILLGVIAVRRIFIVGVAAHFEQRCVVVHLGLKHICILLDGIGYVLYFAR